MWADMLLLWLQAHAIRTLNVAGPREGKRPGIYRLTEALLDAVHAAICHGGAGRMDCRALADGH